MVAQPERGRERVEVALVLQVRHGGAVGVVANQGHGHAERDLAAPVGVDRARMSCRLVSSRPALTRPKACCRALLWRPRLTRRAMARANRTVYCSATAPAAGPGTPPPGARPGPADRVVGQPQLVPGVEVDQVGAPPAAQQPTEPLPGEDLLDEGLAEQRIVQASGLLHREQRKGVDDSRGEDPPPSTLGRFGRPGRLAGIDADAVQPAAGRARLENVAVQAGQDQRGGARPGPPPRWCGPGRRRG